MMITTDNNRLPDRPWPGITTSASSITSQDGIDKYATGNTKTKNQQIKICKDQFTTGTWNVRTLHKTGKVKELEHEMKRYTWNILGLAEVRYTGCGEFMTEEGHKIWFSGEKDKHEKGVAFVVHKNTIKSVLKCSPISSRIITIRIKAQPLNITIIQIYAPTSAYDDNEVELFYQDLEKTIKKVHRKDILIVQGDWNAKVGKDAHENWNGVVGKFGLDNTNDRGIRLLEFAKQHKLVIANTLYRHKRSRTVTWHSPGGISHHQLDFILVQKRYQSSINGAKTRVFPGADINSDHELLMMTLKLKLKAQKKRQSTRIRYDLDKLKNPQILEEFQVTIGGKFGPLLLHENDSVNNLTTKFEQVVTGAALEHLGKKKKVKKPWINEEILQKCDDRRTLKRQRFNDDESAKKYREVNNDLNKGIKLAKEAWINEQCKNIENCYNHNNTKAAFAIVKELTTEWKPKCFVVEDKDGNLLTQAEDVTERWRQYCDELYNHKANTSDNSLKDIQQTISSEEEDEPPILRQEIEEAVRKLKCNKSPGTDNIPAELLKAGGENMVDILLKICNLTLKTGEWPTKWTESIVIPLPKKGNIRKCENNRTISLISHSSKVLLYVLMNRMKPTIKEALDDAQAGFQEGRSTAEQVCNLRILSEKYMDHQLPVYHNFIDFKKAFDRVWHKALWLIMRKYKISSTITKTIKSLYEHAKSLVLIGDTPSKWFLSKVGVRQGCVLSPYLFNLFLEFIMTEALESFDGNIKVGGRMVSNLRFADDIDLIAATEDELRDLTQRLDNTSTKYGMEISAEKSKILITAKEDLKLKQPITVVNQALEQVDTFKYLGSQISNDLYSLSDVKSRIGIATSAMTKLNTIWKNKSISIKTKLRFMRAIVISTMTYGCESWTLNAESEKRLNAFEMKCYRKILQIPYTAHRTNESVKCEIVRKSENHVSLFSIIKQRKLKLFGHVTRHYNELSLAHTIMHGRVPGKRGRGRPRMNWFSNIESWTKMTPYKATKTAGNRQKWREVVESNKVHLRPTGYG